MFLATPQSDEVIAAVRARPENSVCARERTKSLEKNRGRERRRIRPYDHDAPIIAVERPEGMSEPFAKILAALNLVTEQGNVCIASGRSGWPATLRAPCGQ